MSTTHPTLTDGGHHTSAKAPVGTTREPTAVSDEDGKESRRVRLEPLKALLPYLIENKLILVAGGLALLVSAAMMLALPVAVRRIVDHGFSPESRDLINSYFSVLMVMGLVLAVASSARAYCVNWLGENVVARIRSDVFSHLTTLGPAFFASTHSGELMSRLTADTTQVKSAAGNAISQALRNSIMLIGALIMMFVTSAQLSVVLLVAIPAIVFPLLAYGRIVRRLSRRAQDTLAKSSAYAAENLAAVSTLQAYTNERHVSDRFREEVGHALTAATDRLRARAGLTTVAIALITISVVGVLWYGSSLVIAGDMSAGRLSQFVLYAVFAAGALAELAEVMGEVQQAAGAAERLSELLAVVPPIAPVANPKPLPDQLTDGVRFENVSFAYPGRPDTNALDEITLHAPAGRMVALVGPSGAGKSTALNLLLRFYDPGAGRITIDGISIRDVDLTDLRKRLALVSQDVALFADTVSENIRYGSPDATDAEVVAAAKAAQADRFIRELSNGYDTVVGERGVTLSGGQRQRIAIARAILRDAPILLLDEATSALDAENEGALQAALETVMQGRTTLVVAHRLATIQKADQILVFDEGRIVEAGTHAELIGANGLYARLAELQFTGIAA
ncbi:MAG: ABC transporter transmembrane domain-containing protein [Pseudomonadota bacterium]